MPVPSARAAAANPWCQNIAHLVENHDPAVDHLPCCCRSSIDPTFPVVICRVTRAVPRRCHREKHVRKSCVTQIPPAKTTSRYLDADLADRMDQDSVCRRSRPKKHCTRYVLHTQYLDSDPADENIVRNLSSPKELLEILKSGRQFQPYTSSQTNPAPGLTEL